MRSQRPQTFHTPYTVNVPPPQQGHQQVNLDYFLDAQNICKWNFPAMYSVKLCVKGSKITLAPLKLCNDMLCGELLPWHCLYCVITCDVMTYPMTSQSDCAEIQGTVVVTGSEHVLLNWNPGLWPTPPSSTTTPSTLPTVNSIWGLARYIVHSTATALTKLLHHFLCMLDPHP